MLPSADYLKKVIVRGLASATTPVSAVMTPSAELAVLTPQHSVLEAMELMVKLNVRHVPVVRTVAVPVGPRWQRAFEFMNSSSPTPS